MLIRPRAHQALRRIIRAWASANPQAFLVQIGSHDGKTGDPLSQEISNQPDWAGILVEPVPAMFEQLEELRGGHPKFRLVQAAISDSVGTSMMTVVIPQPGMPHWVTQLSSLNEDVVLSHAGVVDALASNLVRLSVRTVTVEVLLEGTNRVDLLHIDTEGHDALILDQFDLGRYQPDLVLFEHKHLRQQDRDRCEQRLVDSHYQLFRFPADTLAVKRIAAFRRTPKTRMALFAARRFAA